MARIIYVSRKKKALISLVVTMLVVAIALYAFESNSPSEAPVFAAEMKSSDLWLGMMQNIMAVSMPESPVSESFLDKVLSKIALTDITQPKRMLAYQLIAMPGNEEWYITEPEDEEILIPVPEEDKQIEQVPPVEKPQSGKPVVGIYCTHNAETYELSDKVEKIEGKNGGVMTAATRLKDALEEQGIGVVLDTTIHDYPSYAKSYSNSLKTAQKLMKDYPSIQILIDIHRDAQPTRESSVTKIDGANVARLSFIVGSDTRLQHPNWRKNWAYANFLADKLEAKYPGMLRGVRVQSGRYNQHVNPHSILLEVGSTNNYTKEAEKSMELFATVLAESMATTKR